MPRPTEYHNRHIFTTSAEKAVYDEFYRITRRDGKTVSSLIQDFMEGYIKTHGDGNDTFKLDKWSENPDFQITPAFDSASLTWSAFLKDCNKQELVDKSIKAKEILDKCHYFYKQK